MRAYINRAREVDILINAIVTENFDLALEEAEEVDAYLNTLDIDYRQHMVILCILTQPAFTNSTSWQKRSRFWVFLLLAKTIYTSKVILVIWKKG